MERVENSIHKDAKDFRYERKFFIHSMDFFRVETLIKLHRHCFYEPYPPRYVNNIYFDTHGLKAFHENVDGLPNRKKIRIRWYGDRQGLVEAPVLEQKIKRGPVGTKVSYKLPPFRFDSENSGFSIEKFLNNSDLPATVRAETGFLIPVLMNRYHRNYFLSSNRRYRLTLDRDMQFSKLSSMNNNLKGAPNQQKGVLIEIKYALEDDLDASQISNLLPFTMTKNSKYINGVYHLYG